VDVSGFGRFDINRMEIGLGRVSRTSSPRCPPQRSLDDPNQSEMGERGAIEVPQGRITRGHNASVEAFAKQVRASERQVGGRAPAAGTAGKPRDDTRASIPAVHGSDPK
jgi:hypothetical protein